jgi:hypothetical protein
VNSNINDITKQQIAPLNWLLTKNLGKKSTMMTPIPMKKNSPGSDEEIFEKFPPAINEYFINSPYNSE